MSRHPAPVTARGLLVDYGGVLTTSVARSFRDFEIAEGLPKGTVFALVEEAYRTAGGQSAIARFETGRSSAQEFGEELAARLQEHGYDVDSARLHERLFAGVSYRGDMWRVVGRAHEQGVRTALLSNSWGRQGYPMEALEEIFDAIVLSGEVGLRKPDPHIFRLAAERIGVPPTQCAFVDDLERNVDAARELGMFGVHHRDPDETARQLEGFLGVSLVGDDATVRSGGPEGIDTHS